MNLEFSAIIDKFQDNDLTFKINFLTPDLLSALQELHDGNDFLKIKVSGRLRKTKQYFQQKAWYGSLRKIMDSLEIDITSENMRVLDNDLRGSLFPVRYIEFGKDTIPSVPRMRDLSFEEMKIVIDRLHERYSYLEIDFSDLRS